MFIDMLFAFSFIQRALIEVVTQNTGDFDAVVLNAQYVSEDYDVTQSYQDGGNCNCLSMQL